MPERAGSMPDDLDRTGPKRIGEHRLRFEEPDLILVDPVGEVTAEASSAIYDEIERFAAGKSYVFSITDIRRVITFLPAARKVAMERGKGIPFRGAAVIGGSVAMRVLSTLMYRAFAIVSPGAESNPVCLCSTEEEARAFIAE